MKSLKSDEKPKRSLENVLQEINRNNIQIRKKDSKFNNAVLFAVLRELIQIMGTRDELFRNMKPKLDYLGSYFDGLRIGQPSEYDINVVLKIPVNYKKIILDATSTTDDYTSILMPSEFRRLSKKPGFIKTRMWCDSQYRLSVTKFRSWMQSVVDAALTTLPQYQDKRILCVNDKRYQIYAKTAGPANTITIVTDNMEGNIIDVDLVPTFEFKYPQKAIGSKVLFEKLKCSEHYFVVPKPSHNDYSWRLSFPLQERYHIKDKNNLKSTLRLLKLLRDVQGFKLLASYFIKSLFLYETDLKRENFWRKHSMSYLLIYMMKKLTECLQKGEIKNYWCPDSNLLKGKLNIETCQNWSNRLAFIINDIEQNGKNNPQILLQYFTKKTSV